MIENIQLQHTHSRLLEAGWGVPGHDSISIKSQTSFTALKLPPFD